MVKLIVSEASSPKKYWLGWFICSMAAAFYCYEYLLRIIPGVMQPELQIAFGNISGAAFGNLSAYYYYAYTPMQIPVGMLMDRYGPRKLLTMASLMCALGAGIFANAQTLFTASIGRAFVGFGSAFAFVGVLSLANSWLPKRVFGMAAGLTTALGMVGAMIGEVVLTLLVRHSGWQKTLQWSAWLGCLITLCIILFVKDSPTVSSKKLSVRQLMHETAHILSSVQIWLIGVCGAFLYLSLSVFAEVWGKSYLMAVHHLSNLQAAEAVSLVFLGWAIGGPIAGLLSDTFKNRVLPLMLGSIFAMLCVSALLYMTRLPLLVIDLLLFLYGIFSSVQVLIFALATENSPPKLAGTAIAVINMIVMLGGAIFQPLVGKFLDTLWSGDTIHQIHVFGKVDYQISFSILPISLGFVAIMSFLLRETRARNVSLEQA